MFFSDLQKNPKETENFSLIRGKNTFFFTVTSNQIILFKNLWMNLDFLWSSCISNRSLKLFYPSLVDSVCVCMWCVSGYAFLCAVCVHVCLHMWYTCSCSLLPVFKYACEHALVWWVGRSQKTSLGVNHTYDLVWNRVSSGCHSIKKTVWLVSFEIFLSPPPPHRRSSRITNIHTTVSFVTCSLWC